MPFESKSSRCVVAVAVQCPAAYGGSGCSSGAPVAPCRTAGRACLFGQLGACALQSAVLCHAVPCYAVPSRSCQHRGPLHGVGCSPTRAAQHAAAGTGDYIWPYVSLWSAGGPLRPSLQLTLIWLTTAASDVFPGCSTARRSETLAARCVLLSAVSCPYHQAVAFAVIISRGLCTAHTHMQCVDAAGLLQSPWKRRHSRALTDLPCGGLEAFGSSARVLLPAPVSQPAKPCRSQPSLWGSAAGP